MEGKFKHNTKGKYGLHARACTCRWRPRILRKRSLKCLVSLFARVFLPPPLAQEFPNQQFHWPTWRRLLCDERMFFATTDGDDFGFMTAKPANYFDQTFPL